MAILLGSSCVRGRCKHVPHVMIIGHEVRDDHRLAICQPGKSTRRGFEEAHFEQTAPSISVGEALPKTDRFTGAEVIVLWRRGPDLVTMLFEMLPELTRTEPQRSAHHHRA